MVSENKQEIISIFPSALSNHFLPLIFTLFKFYARFKLTLGHLKTTGSKRATAANQFCVSTPAHWHLTVPPPQRELVLDGRGPVEWHQLVAWLHVHLKMGQMQRLTSCWTPRGNTKLHAAYATDNESAFHCQYVFLLQLCVALNVENYTKILVWCIQLGVLILPSPTATVSHPPCLCILSLD